MIDQAVAEVEPWVGTTSACRALGASRASLYRRRTPPGPAPRRPRRAPARTLSGAERHAVLAERPRRRRFTAEYKLGVLREAEACTRKGEIGAMLRREGLYSSHLTAWRKQRDAGALEGLAPRKRGPRGPSAEQVENEQLRRRAERAEGAGRSGR